MGNHTYKFSNRKINTIHAKITNLTSEKINDDKLSLLSKFFVSLFANSIENTNARLNTSTKNFRFYTLFNIFHSDLSVCAPVND